MKIFVMLKGVCMSGDGKDCSAKNLTVSHLTVVHGHVILLLYWSQHQEGHLFACPMLISTMAYTIWFCNKHAGASLIRSDYIANLRFPGLVTVNEALEFFHAFFL